ncbi:MAG: hypothetical protein ABI574_13255 [Burkholderiales bacterium]
MSYTLLSEQPRIARRTHRCIWCWGLIKPGESYTDERSVCDGGFQRHRWHPECRVAMLAEAAAEGGLIEWTPGQERPVAAREAPLL